MATISFYCLVVGTNPLHIIPQALDIILVYLEQKFAHSNPPDWIKAQYQHRNFPGRHGSNLVCLEHELTSCSKLTTGRYLMNIAAGKHVKLYGAYMLRIIVALQFW